MNSVTVQLLMASKNSRNLRNNPFDVTCLSNCTTNSTYKLLSHKIMNTSQTDCYCTATSSHRYSILNFSFQNMTTCSFCNGKLKHDIITLSWFGNDLLLELVQCSTESADGWASRIQSLWRDEEDSKFLMEVKSVERSHIVLTIRALPFMKAEANGCVACWRKWNYHLR